MYRKSNPITLASFCRKEEIKEPFLENSEIWSFPKTNLRIACKPKIGITYYKVFFEHSFLYQLPSRISDRERYMLLYKSAVELSSTAEKLKYFRYKNFLYQEQVAELVGLDRSTYSYYEDCSRKFYSFEILEKIAHLYSVPITELLDDYTLFLYNGQGQAIKTFRKKRGFTQQTFADYLNVSKTTIRKWEKEVVHISKEYYQKLFSVSNV